MLFHQICRREKDYFTNEGTFLFVLRQLSVKPYDYSRTDQRVKPSVKLDLPAQAGGMVGGGWGVGGSVGTGVGFTPKGEQKKYILTFAHLKKVLTKMSQSKSHKGPAHFLTANKALPSFSEAACGVLLYTLDLRVTFL